MVSRDVRRFNTTGKAYVEFSSNDDFMERIFGLDRGHILCAAMQKVGPPGPASSLEWVVYGVKVRKIPDVNVNYLPKGVGEYHPIIGSRPREMITNYLTGLQHLPLKFMD